MKQSHHAFTLVEMLLVVAVISLLVGLLLPALNETRTNTRSMVCLANLNQFMHANVAFASANAGYSVRTLEPNPDAPSGGMWWTSSLFEFQHPGKLVFCPEADTGLSPTMGTLDIGERHQSWFDGVQYPHATDKPETGSYGQNMWVSRFRGSMTNWGFPQSHHWSGRLNNPFASEVPLFSDAIWTGGYVQQSDVPLAYEGGMSGQMNRFALRRHHRKVNICFLDGSAKNMELGDMWTLRWNKLFVPTEGVAVPWD